MRVLAAFVFIFGMNSFLNGCPDSKDELKIFLKHLKNACYILDSTPYEKGDYEQDIKKFFIYCYEKDNYQYGFLIDPFEKDAYFVRINDQELEKVITKSNFEFVEPFFLSLSKFKLSDFNKFCVDSESRCFVLRSIFTWINLKCINFN